MTTFITKFYQLADKSKLVELQQKQLEALSDNFKKLPQHRKHNHQIRKGKFP